MDVSEGSGGHSVWGKGVISESHGELKACRQLLSIRKRLSIGPLHRQSWMPYLDRFPNLTDPHLGVQVSSTRLFNFEFDPETEIMCLNKFQIAETRRQGSDGALNRESTRKGKQCGPDVPQIEFEDYYTTFTSLPSSEDLDRTIESIGGCMIQEISPRVNMSNESALLLGNGGRKDAQTSEAAGGWSTRSARAEVLSKREVMLMLEELYKDHPGAVWRRASQEAIDAVEAQGREKTIKFLTYGEISFIAFVNLLETYAPTVVRPRSNIGEKDHATSSGFVFYDLGCGSGRPVFAASLFLTNCVKSCGIEIIPSMHKMNQTLLQLYDVELRKRLHPAKQMQNITFLFGDMLQVDWSDANIVFVNATCFDDTLFQNLEARAEKILKEGTIVIVITHHFKNVEVWELMDKTERRMSWSSAMVSVYRKKT